MLFSYANEYNPVICSKMDVMEGTEDMNEIS